MSVNPFEESESFYANNGKNQKIKTMIGYPRSSNLEEKDKRKPVFVGDSELMSNRRPLLHQISNRNSSTLVENSCIEILRSTADLTIVKASEKKNKIQEHGQAIQETQLVGFDRYSHDTLKNNVDLEKVREAKRVLRRRYANRKNLYKIFAAWDQDNTKTITVGNIFSMAQNLGLNLNIDESRVLLASANKNSTGALQMDEFFDLIYNKDDILNVNLDALAGINSFLSKLS